MTDVDPNPFGVAVPPNVRAHAQDAVSYLGLVEAFRKLDISDAELVLSSQPPSFAVEHPRQLALFSHHAAHLLRPVGRVRAGRLRCRRGPRRQPTCRPARRQPISLQPALLHRRRGGGQGTSRPLQRPRQERGSLPPGQRLRRATPRRAARYRVPVSPLRDPPRVPQALRAVRPGHARRDGRRRYLRWERRPAPVRARPRRPALGPPELARPPGRAAVAQPRRAEQCGDRHTRGR